MRGRGASGGSRDTAQHGVELALEALDAGALGAELGFQSPHRTEDLFHLAVQILVLETSHVYLSAGQTAAILLLTSLDHAASKSKKHARARMAQSVIAAPCRLPPLSGPFGLLLRSAVSASGRLPLASDFRRVSCRFVFR